MASANAFFKPAVLESVSSTGSGGVAASVCEWKHAGHANEHQMCQSPEKCTKPNQTLQKQYEQTGVQVQHYSLQLKNLHLHQLHVCFISPASY